MDFQEGELRVALTDLLQAIQKEKVLPMTKAVNILGTHSLAEFLRKEMLERKYLMPRDDDSFEFTFEGLKEAMLTYVPQLVSDGKDITEENLMKIARG